MAKPTYNTNDIAKVKDLDADRVEAAINWMSAVLSEDYTDFFEDIKDGVELCKLLNAIKPGLIAEKKFKKSKIVFVCRTNIQLFIEGCKKLGIPETDCIETRDLYDKQDLASVIENIYAVDRIAGKHGYTSNSIQGNSKYATKNVRQFDAATLAKSKSAVPQMAKGGIYQKTSGQDGYGIVKTDKSMQQPSQVQGVWAQGAKKVDNKGMDGYGIVKTDKSMQNPSQVQSAWQKGSFKQENKGMDGYGIVKTEKDMQKPSQVQSVWAKGAKKVENKGMDGYGIVKTDKDMQNPSQVQGAWQQGANKVENKGMDGYGIVKTDKDMQNPSQAQGAWQQGAVAQENNGMDSYGIVKTAEE
eukprot:CAMPEP_0201566962 /NCGR_PEP_ID=MMETSP0190_2-20130828/7151_1 /ASSEMBLY_ACC=CAM_ASM_000263 /TAXON_ID=37353 /ORGANISM="Rosalina sp." /LENGTH=355 /DNA_ID=CAMNT_0047986365 /DNA_START=88 /DNA_END=1155 /DNA_ORIENTATION=-